jgi:hypothetical protein
MNKDNKRRKYSDISNNILIYNNNEDKIDEMSQNYKTSRGLFSRHRNRKKFKTTCNHIYLFVILLIFNFISVSFSQRGETALCNPNFVSIILLFLI